MTSTNSLFFHPDELAYYSRHLSLETIGIEGQKKLKNAKVLCIGAGGLGCPLLVYLAAAGVGTLGIVDDDRVDLSNLHRQILYTQADVGTLKVDIACKKLHQLNRYISTIAHPLRLIPENAFDLFSPYDIVVDCSDNFFTRYLINDVCFYLNKPNVQASISQFDGQCSVFTAPKGPCYRCLFDVPPPLELLPNCAQAGVLGVLPGLLGNIQALEVIKLIVGIGLPLIGRLLKIDTLSMTFKELSVSKNPECRLCHYHEAFETLQRGNSMCASNIYTEDMSISPSALKALQAKQSVFILDVRESYEYEAFNMGGYLIPLAQLPHRLMELNARDTIVVHCKTGPRSQRALAILKQAGFDCVFYLAGGIAAWQAEINR